MNKPGDEQVSSAFKPLEQVAFQNLELGASLKGLLKPFKGKRELEAWGRDCEHLRDQLIDLCKHKILAQTKSYPFALLPIRLVQHRTGHGPIYLRWSDLKRTKMGEELWQSIIQNPKTPNHLITDLIALEQQRIVINMQISVLHSMMRQALECVQKMHQAQISIDKRVL
ncbi:MAG: DUF3158 family protein [Saezia sp.]